MRNIMSKSPTATTMTNKYSVRNHTSNTSNKYKKITLIQSWYSALQNIYASIFRENSAFGKPSAIRVVTRRDIMSKSPTATTMAIRYSVRNRSSNTSWKYKKIIPIKIPSLYSLLKNMFDTFFCENSSFGTSVQKELSPRGI